MYLGFCHVWNWMALSYAICFYFRRNSISEQTQRLITALRKSMILLAHKQTNKQTNKQTRILPCLKIVLRGWPEVIP